MRNGHSVVAELLLQRGSDPRRADDLVGNALHYVAQGLGPGRPALTRPWIELMDLVIRFGAGLHPRLSLDAVSGVQATATVAALQGAVVTAVQPEPEPEPKSVQRGWTALHRACYSGQWRLAVALVIAGSDVTVLDFEGRPAAQIRPAIIADAASTNYKQEPTEEEEAETEEDEDEDEDDEGPPAQYGEEQRWLEVSNASSALRLGIELRKEAAERAANSNPSGSPLPITVGSPLAAAGVDDDPW